MTTEATPQKEFPLLLSTQNTLDRVTDIML